MKETSKVVVPNLHLGLVRKVYLHVRVGALLQHRLGGDKFHLFHLDNLRRLRLDLRVIGEVTCESCDVGHHLLESHTFLSSTALHPMSFIT